MQQIHMKAPNNWINDPNGFIYYKGKYHLFYQYFPYAPQWGTMHWGHAVSDDLVNWEHCGIALYPTKWDDRNGCFSGSAIEHDGKMYVFYTGVRYLEVNPENIHKPFNEQFEPTQMMITSEDGFRFDNWNAKRTIIPAIENIAVGDRIHTRDPKVWRGKNGWYLVLGSSLNGQRGQALLYRSNDLIHWEYAGKAMNGALPGWGWECPDYFECDGTGMMLFSAMGFEEMDGKPQNHSLCCTASFDEDCCRMSLSDQYQMVDYGKDLYAPQTTTDAQGRRVMVAWLRMPHPTAEGWIGMFTAPRVVEYKEGRIYFHLHPAIHQAFQKPIASASQADSGIYCIRTALHDGEELKIGDYRIYRANGKLYADRSALGDVCEGCQMISETPPVQDGYQIEVIVDKNIIEIFVNDGEFVITHVVYDLEQQVTASAGVQLQMYTVGSMEE